MSLNGTVIKRVNKNAVFAKDVASYHDTIAGKPSRIGTDVYHEACRYAARTNGTTEKVVKMILMAFFEEFFRRVAAGAVGAIPRIGMFVPRDPNGSFRAPVCKFYAGLTVRMMHRQATTSVLAIDKVSAQHWNDLTRIHSHLRHGRRGESGEHMLEIERRYIRKGKDVMSTQKKTPGPIVEDTQTVGVVKPDGSSAIIPKPTTGKVAESVGHTTDPREQLRRSK